jgi:hypothetical protein
LSDRLEQLIDSMRGAFPSAEQFSRVRRQWLAGVLNLGRHTVTGALSAAGREHQDWSNEYRVWQQLPVAEIFAQIGKECRERSTGAWVLALDDSCTRKTGRRIPGCGWRRDPLSPPFHVNFTWGQRVLQFSAALPASDGSARLVPVDWTEAPVPCPPRRGASSEQLDAYAEARKQANINRVALSRIESLRQQTDRELHLVVDGRFTNRTVLRALPGRTVVIGRIRKDTKLYFPPHGAQTTGRPRRYGEVAPTPEQLRADETPWQTVAGWAVDRLHEFKVKSLGPVMVRIRGVSAPARIVVIAPMGYRLRAGSRVLYRQPAYLICTNAELPLQDILQQYLWRWDIEVNFRDEKSILGVSEAQLRQPEAVRRQPAGVVAAYALLLLAAHDCYGPQGQPPNVPLPKWRRRQPPSRPTTARLISQLRVEYWSGCLRRDTLRDFSSPSPSDEKSSKLHSSLASAVFHAHS